MVLPNVIRIIAIEKRPLPLPPIAIITITTIIIIITITITIIVIITIIIIELPPVYQMICPKRISLNVYGSALNASPPVNSFTPIVANRFSKQNKKKGFYSNFTRYTIYLYIYL